MLLFTVLAVWCASGYAQGAVPAQDKPFYPEAAHAQHFAEFKVTYHKQYATPEEERRRFTAFKNNLAKINELNSLDEHAVYDCAKNVRKKASPLQRFIYVHLSEQKGFTGYRGFVKEDDYKYIGRQGNCTFDKKKVVGRYYACEVVLSKENHIVKYLRLGPLAAMVDRRAFRYYRSGVITKCTFKGYNHAVLMTGYGKEHGVPFWTVKNSKGEKWGEKGYARIKRGVACLGIAQPKTLTTVFFKDQHFG